MLHLIAILSGLLAFLLILSWMRAQEDVVEVVVASDLIRSGNVITGEMFETVEIPAAAAFGANLMTPAALDRLVGSVATRTITEGEPVLGSDLRPVDTPMGLRAMSVPVDINRAVGGELNIGDRVDVIGFDATGAHYIATDIEVLDVPGARSSTFGATTSFAVTLAVDDVQALGVAQALDFGVVHLLRSTGSPDVTLERIVADPGLEVEIDAPPNDPTGDGSAEVVEGGD